MNSFQRPWRWLKDEPHQRIGIRILQTTTGLMLLFRVFTEFPFTSYLWGPRGLGYSASQIGVGVFWGSLLDFFFASELGARLILYGLAGAAFLLVIGYQTQISTLFALLTSSLILRRLPELADGGDNITNLVLIYMLFLLPAHTSPRPGSIRIWLHNLGVLAIGVQLAVLYLTSGFLKASGETWQHGTAMYLISQVEWFSLPALRHYFQDPLVATLSSYVPMFYQLWFPIAILSPLKIPWLAIGAFFHLGIAVFMGLVTFSTAMIGLELFLISDREYAHLFEKLHI